MIFIKTEINRSKILEALVTCKTIDEVAKEVGVSRKTIYHYMNKDTTLMRSFRDFKRDQLRDISARLTDCTNIAIDTMIELAKNEKCSDMTRLNASSKILEMFIKTREIDNKMSDVTWFEVADMTDTVSREYISEVTERLKR